jgi:hypothetical protein
MRELLDIATKYTMGDEAVLANLSGKGKATPSIVVGMVTTRPTQPRVQG